MVFSITLKVTHSPTLLDDVHGRLTNSMVDAIRTVIGNQRKGCPNINPVTSVNAEIRTAEFNRTMPPGNLLGSNVPYGIDGGNVW